MTNAGARRGSVRPFPAPDATSESRGDVRDARIGVSDARGRHRRGQHGL